ncbi:coil containing protein [Vibrio phage 1.199.A._10N.286.55.C10]|nr:coil containing protein [Vibrio phage 1.199.A._10N.286.55.C10]AUR94952.1 coil containing protein [Vibrio phage 1.199.B._10N.286.55.C10]
MKMSDLKPCPFCGADPMYYKSFTKVTIGCRSADCHVNPTFSIGKREDPEEKWNSRIGDRMVEEIAELRKGLEIMIEQFESNHNCEYEYNIIKWNKDLLAKLNQEGKE